jgi:hypothetical protein
MKNIVISFYLLLLLLEFASCKKFVDIPPSTQLITSDAIFTNDNTAVSAVDGVYIALRTASPGLANGSLSIFCGLSGDEIVNTAASTIYDPFYSNNIPSTNSTVSANFWSQPYNVIYRTNAILEELAKTNSLSPSVKGQLTGEMKFVRALIYFQLVNIYGDVPLIITSDYNLSSNIDRTPVNKVYEQIISDLLNAQQSLINAYPSNGKSRPNLQTATALLAKVYLYQKDWANAEIQASEVISSNLYTLTADLNSVFLINANETIWEIAGPSELRNSVEGALFIPASATAKPTFSISTYLLNAFENGDKRKTSWLKANVVSGLTYYYPYKFKNRTTTSITEYDIAFRLAEQYLIRAESRAQQGSAKLIAALSDVNIIRSRAGLSPLVTTLNQQQCMSAIAQERRIELFTEWGNRWFDLKRTGTIDAVLSAEKTGWKNSASLFPLPNLQVQTNTKLIQNPGYN